MERPNEQIICAVSFFLTLHPMAILKMLLTGLVLPAGLAIMFAVCSLSLIILGCFQRVARSTKYCVFPKQIYG